jgi:hypothetical protein
MVGDTLAPLPPGYAATHVQNSDNSPSRNFAQNVEASSTDMSYYTKQNNSPSGYMQDSAFQQTDNHSAPMTPERVHQQSGHKGVGDKSSAKATRSATRLTRELKEATQLLESSYSPQGETFWHHQIADLKTKLREIGPDVEEDDKTKKTKKNTNGDNDSVRTLGSKPKMVDTSSNMSEP